MDAGHSRSQSKNAWFWGQKGRLSSDIGMEIPARKANRNYWGRPGCGKFHILFRCLKPHGMKPCPDTRVEGTVSIGGTWDRFYRQRRFHRFGYAAVVGMVFQKSPIRFPTMTIL